MASKPFKPLLRLHNIFIFILWILYLFFESNFCCFLCFLQMFDDFNEFYGTECVTMCETSETCGERNASFGSTVRRETKVGVTYNTWGHD